MFSPISRRSRCDKLGQHVGDVQDCAAAAVCWREKASSWRTRLAARLAFCLICMMSAERLVARLVAQQQQIAEADHRGQQVVEVVGDAAGQLADRLHLLALGELGLQALLLGQIDEVEDHSGTGTSVAGHSPAAPARRRA